MKSPIAKRSIVVAGEKTSVSLEEEFWAAFRAIARSRGLRLADLAGQIDIDRKQGNLSSAVRLFILRHYQDIAAKAEAAKVPTDTDPTQPEKD
jgi:predicted DNA-binding ribbon-helix-helix protein